MGDALEVEGQADDESTGRNGKALARSLWYGVTWSPSALLVDHHLEMCIAEPPEVERAPLSEILIKSPRTRALPAPFAIDRQANDVGSAINVESSLRSLLWSHMDQSAGIRVFQQPQRTVGRLFHIANTFADIPA